MFPFSLHSFPSGFGFGERGRGLWESQDSQQYYPTFPCSYKLPQKIVLGSGWSQTPELLVHQLIFIRPSQWAKQAYKRQQYLQTVIKPEKNKHLAFLFTRCWQLDDCVWVKMNIQPLILQKCLDPSLCLGHCPGDMLWPKQTATSAPEEGRVRGSQSTGAGLVSDILTSRPPAWVWVHQAARDC